MKDWQRIRLARTDLTDYVIHFTKIRIGLGSDDSFPNRPMIAQPKEVFTEILNDGFIYPSFAPMRSQMTGTTSNTVRGPHPAVCLTEQPLSAVLITRRCAGGRYSGFGIAYHKYALYQEGGRPVIYGPKNMMGRRLQPGEDGFEKGKDIYTGGLPMELQYLWVQYKPSHEYMNDYPIDFTWEREWRYPCRGSVLPIYLEKQAYFFKPDTPIVALIVEKDTQLDEVRNILSAKVKLGLTWASKINRIVSLETAERMLSAGDQRYSRIETWPEQDIS